MAKKKQHWAEGIDLDKLVDAVSKKIKESSNKCEIDENGYCTIHYDQHIDEEN